MEKEKYNGASKAEFVKYYMVEEFECDAEGLYSKVCELEQSHDEIYVLVITARHMVCRMAWI